MGATNCSRSSLKIVYLLRTVDCTQHPAILSDFDERILLSLEQTIGCPLNESSRIQASIPVSMGGFGLRSASRHSSPSYIGSLNFSNNLLSDICPPDLAIPTPQSAFQHLLSLLLIN